MSAIVCYRKKGIMLPFVVLKLILPALELNRNAKKLPKLFNVPKLRIILKTVSSAIKNWIQSALEVSKTCAPALTYARQLSSVPLSGDVHYLNEMVTEFMKHSVWWCSIFWPAAPSHDMYPGALGSVDMEWKQTLQGSYIWKMNAF